MPDVILVIKDDQIPFTWMSSLVTKLKFCLKITSAGWTDDGHLGTGPDVRLDVRDAEC